MNLMRTGLKITSNKYHSKPDRYAIRISKQPNFFRENHIAYNNGDIRVISSAYPEWSGIEEKLYIQGYDSSRNNEKIHIEGYNFLRIKRAIIDCNNALCEKNKPSIY